jgi:hypothetical protein
MPFALFSLPVPTDWPFTFAAMRPHAVHEIAHTALRSLVWFATWKIAGMIGLPIVLAVLVLSSAGYICASARKRATGARR